MSSERESSNSSDQTSENEPSHMSDYTSNEESYNASKESAEELVYDTSAQPLATQEEHTAYERVVSFRSAEQQQMAARFSRELPVDSW